MPGRLGLALPTTNRRYMNKKQIKEHLQWLKKFTDCKEVKSVPSRNRRKVQRKTNKSNESSTAHV